MLLIIGTIDTLTISTIKKLQEKETAIAFCTQIRDDRSLITSLTQNTYPLFIINFNELEPFLHEHQHSITTVVNFSAFQTPPHTQPDLLMQIILRTSQKIWLWCAKYNKRYIYTSSQHTYQGPHCTFTDGYQHIHALKPFSLIAWANQLMDRWVAHMLQQKGPKPPQTISLKFFNMYGGLSSLIDNIITSMRKEKPISIWKSQHTDFDDGCYIRHFSYVEDCSSVVCWVVESPHVPNTTLNIASNQGHTFLEATNIIHKQIQKPYTIEYEPLPPHLHGTPPIENPNTNLLLSLGYRTPFLTLAEGVKATLDSTISFCS